MEEHYNPEQLETLTQKYWEEHQSFKVTEDLSKEKFYCLSMFPYPSGQLHMGHVRNYTIGDVISRYERLRGKNVLQPMGWDAFGLPAENAAIKNNVPPAKWTYANIDYMRSQLKRLGFAYDWRREITTCHPDYYRWEQWFFLKLYEKGLVYKKNATVNWDPVDQTVLANEQVVDGRGWRSGALVERREIPQWFIKITAYAEQLLNNLDQLEEWPDQVRTMQRNWIGRSEGIEINFQVSEGEQLLVVFTTRPDTLMGVTYLAIAAQHPLAIKAAQTNPDIAKFIEECSHIQVAEAALATIEKRGINSGFSAIHPITGQELPVWIANFVVIDYGSGAVMAVPAHDQRDFEFAMRYNLLIKEVIASPDNKPWDYTQAAFTEPGILKSSGEFTNLSSKQACVAIGDYLEKHHKGIRKTHFRIRDWSVSRQRYWGTPIPMINCPTCGSVPVPENELPVILPENITFTGTQSPLKNIPEFYETTCPVCHEPAKRETDTFDTFMESSWYYARFSCKNQDKTMLDDRAKYWTPVDYYIGGIEHAVMHLLYARFFHKLLRDAGLVNSDEPFIKLLTQGMVLKDGSKMSKSKGNTVDPQQLINKFGADTVRLFIIFASPPEQSLEWSDSGVEGSYRFLKRLWNFAFTHHKNIRTTNHLYKASLTNTIDWEKVHPTQREARRKIYEILRQVRYDFERTQLNTVVSSCMKLLNLLEILPAPDLQPEETYKPTAEIKQQLLGEGLSILLRLLSPITPHITHHLWRELEYDGLIINAKWPKVATDALKTAQIELVVQINGKLRARVNVPSEADEEAIKQIVVSDTTVTKHIADKTIKKIIIVPNKLINIVI